MIVAQYYQFIRLGFGGYKKIMVSLLNVAARLQKGIEDLGEHTVTIWLHQNDLSLLTTQNSSSPRSVASPAGQESELGVLVLPQDARPGFVALLHSGHDPVRNLTLQGEPCLVTVTVLSILHHVTAHA